MKKDIAVIKRQVVLINLINFNFMYHTHTDFFPDQSHENVLIIIPNI